ncbi:hydroxyurea phosphotransferase [Streptomyces harbinensis]|uniref:aminoglycoside phosphotransferase family protein n=1 Tax=Streptomyces harbinensis TaxID=1176198 RepID=UPI0015920B98|nr:aminoglycoside phosphotransferase family protein [Streptomyces harbinensis]QKV70186.1 hydroxyurea phosphotransferase [Streptomyces harbinensis]
MRAPIEVPAGLAATYAAYHGAPGAAWIAALPRLAATLLERWDLRPDGPAAHGVCALVLPVVRTTDGTPAALKLQMVDEETAGESLALATWAGRGAVRLLAHDPASGSMLLERLAPRSLEDVPDDLAALEVLSGLLARLATVPAPPGLRTLAGIGARMLERTPALAAYRDPADRALYADCAAALREVLPEPGGSLLHWDLHYANVLAGEREPWLAIDPKPLAGDPCFDLFPALRNRFTEITAAPDPRRALRRRFDLMTATAALDRDRAVAWTLARILQDALWAAESGTTTAPPTHTLTHAALHAP